MKLWTLGFMMALAAESRVCSVLVYDLFTVRCLFWYFDAALGLSRVGTYRCPF